MKGIKMEDSRKRNTAIIVVSCMILAGAVTFMTRSGEDSGIKSLKGQILVKCRNPKCGTSYEMSEREFYTYIQDHKNATNPLLPIFLPCKKCGEKAIDRAIKCEKCGEIFIEGTAGLGDYSDKCPKCGYSQLESQIKQKK